MNLYEYLGPWLKVIDFQKLMEALNAVHNMYKRENITPEEYDTLEAFRYCDLYNLKVIIIGQDPYPQKGVCTGIAFANNSPPYSPSLEKLKESVIDYTRYHGEIRFDNTLHCWEEQGVLLLNTALTVRVGCPGSHTAIWRDFVTSFVEKVSFFMPGTVFLLLGSEARTLKPYISKNCYVLQENHPSFYARTRQVMPHEIFVKIDTILNKLYGYSIKWYDEQKD